MMASPSRYLDSHCHLQASRLTPAIDRILERARRAGVARMFCNATREEDWQTVVDLAASRQEIVPFLGIHPWFAETAETGWDERLRGLLKQIPAGIGETGLDKNSRADFTRQQQIFLTQLQMASELRRPLVIHCVKAWGILLELLEESTNPLPPIMIHSFNGSRETLYRLIRLGCFISFSGRLATESNLHPCFLETPLPNLLMETDGPSQPDRQGPPASSDQEIFSNEPAAIPLLYQSAARKRDMDLPKFCQEIWRNGEIFTDTILPR
jgi:TatD DNase family protein